MTQALPEDRTEPAETPETGGVTRPTGAWGALYRWAAVALGAFALWAAGPGIAEDQIHLGLFTAVMWALAFLVFPLRKTTTWPAPTMADTAIGLAIVVAIAGIALRADQTAETGYQTIDWGLWLLAGGGAIAALRRPRGYDLAFLGLAVLCVSYYVYFYLDLADRAGGWTPTDTVVAGTAVLIALEAARRGIGPWISAIALFALLYAHFGSYFPEAVAHRGASVSQIVNYSFYSQEGIFGVMTTVMANYVLIFIYLGAFMHRSGMGQFFIDLPMALAGRTAGGPAKVAVAASAVFGSISGSTLANVVSTGALTIPLMKRVGFRPHVAGAVENSASLGGQLLPPVMGAGVFIMAEITGIPYVQIIGVAAVPALLYLFSIGLIVHFEARRRGIEGVRDSEVDSAWSVFRRGWFHLLPFCVLLSFLVAGYSPDWCAVMAIVTTVLINWIRVALARAGLAPTPRHVLGLRTLRDTLVDGTTNALGIGAAAAGIGLIVGMMAMTGLGLKMSLIIVELSAGNLLIALLLVALASLVLGMALPITASYLVLVVIAGPALQELGLALIAAHMIVFWLSQDSNITPPVCLGAFVAASLAKADPWKTAWASFRFAKMLYIVPILFAYTPILMTGSTGAAIWTMGSAVFGTIAFAAWTAGYFRRNMDAFEWVAVAIIAVLCFWPVDRPVLAAPGWAINVGGALMLVALYFWQRYRKVLSEMASDND